MSSAGDAGDRWYLSGPLGVGTAFDEPTDAHSTQGVGWGGVGTAVRHDRNYETLNLLDGRPAAAGRGPNLNWWGLNAAGKAVRLATVGARLVATADGAASGYLALFAKPAGGDVAEALRVTGSGDVGIGTPAPQARLHVAGGKWNPTDTEGDLKVGDATFRLKVGVATGGGGAGDVRIRAHGGTNRLMLGSGVLDTLFVVGDRIGIGKIDPAVRLDVAGETYIRGNLVVGAGGNAAVRVRHIDGKQTGADGDDGLHLNWATGTDVHIGGHKPAGLMVHGPATAHVWRTLSDAALKTNICRLDDVLDKLDHLRGVSFEYNAAGPLAPDRAGAGETGHRGIGVIAQEVATVFPELVSATGERGLLAVNYAGLSGVLVEGLKELKQELAALRGRVEGLAAAGRPE